MKVCILTSLLLILAHCFGSAESSIVNQSQSPNASRVVDSLPAPDDQAIRKIRTANQWRNPFVIVHRDGYELIVHRQPRNQVLLSLDELEDALLKMGAVQWPLGKVIAVQEAGLRSPDDGTQIELKLRAVLRMLASHKLRIDQWPSA